MLKRKMTALLDSFWFQRAAKEKESEVVVVEGEMVARKYNSGFIKYL